jgi:tetratricopeptide (TPR) repeat protein
MNTNNNFNNNNYNNNTTSTNNSNSNNKLDETIVGQVTKIKEEGNTLFKQNKYEDAIKKYYEAIQEIKTSTDKDKYKNELNELEKQCRLNIVNCKLKTKDYDGVINECSIVLENNKCFKAYYRMGLALFHKKKYDKAFRYLDNANAIGNQSEKSAVEPHLKECKEKLDEMKKKEREERRRKEKEKEELEKQKEKEKEKEKKEKKEENNIINNEKDKIKDKKSELYDIEDIINNIKEKDPKAYVPIVLPFEKEDNKKNLKEELNNENGLFIFQFPRQIPIKDLNLQIKAKEEENTNEEPNYDENGFLISQEFKNSFQELKDNTKIGKLIIMKSGKIKIKIGDIYFDINEGSLTKFAQYSAIVTGNDDNQAFILGQPLNKKLIVTPEFD